MRFVIEDLRLKTFISKWKVFYIKIFSYQSISSENERSDTPNFY